MKTALVTDLHANREAVETVMAHAREQGAQAWAFLGDFVGYGADPAWVIDTVRELVAQGAVAVQGNHDLATVRHDTSKGRSEEPPFDDRRLRRQNFGDRLARPSRAW